MSDKENSVSDAQSTTDVERLYQEEIRVDFEGELEDIAKNLWGAERNIDWGQSLVARPQEQELLKAMATQFHYNNLSELSLCGRIIQNELLLEMKMIASLLAVSKIRNIGTWNKYLLRMNVSSQVPPPEKEYFNTLTKVEDSTSLLLGMSVIGKVCWLSLCENLHDLNDPVFQDILKQVRQQKEAKLEYVQPYLARSINEMDDAAVETIQQHARFFRGQSRETVLYHHGALSALGKSPQTLANHVEEGINRFYRNVGLDV